jgi:lysophospholipase L1-like esterase
VEKIDRRKLLHAGIAAIGAAAVAGTGPAAGAAPNPPAGDWPNLERYRDDNRRLRESGVSVDVVFLGDSITEGWHAKAPQFFARGRVCRGISGQTTPQMLLRFHSDVVRLAPRVVHILAGTNDVAGNTGPMMTDMSEDNFSAMGELARAHGIAVIFAAIPPATDFPWRPGLETVAPIATLNTWLRAQARRADAVYADYFTALSDGKGGMRAGLSYDHVHPTEQGYAAMRPVAEQAIAAALEKHVHTGRC